MPTNRFMGLTLLLVGAVLNMQMESAHAMQMLLPPEKRVAFLTTNITPYYLDTGLKTNTPPQTNALPDQTLCMVIIAGTCIVLTGVVLYQPVCKMFSAPLPLPTPPPPFPIIGIVPVPMDAGGGIVPIVPTNYPPGTNFVLVTNRAYFWTPPQLKQITPTGPAPASVSVAYDISALGWADSNNPVTVPYTALFITQLTNLQSSTDLVHWSNFTITGWLSPLGMATVLRDGSGRGTATNYSPANVMPKIPLGIWVDGGPYDKKYLRVWPWKN